jgi:hypothetical protein
MSSSNTNLVALVGLEGEGARSSSGTNRNEGISWGYKYTGACQKSAIEIGRLADEAVGFVGDFNLDYVNLAPVPRALILISNGYPLPPDGLTASL